MASTDLGISVWLSMVLAVVAGVIVGVVLAWPSVKLPHHFLALVTIGFGEIARLLFSQSPRSDWRVRRNRQHSGAGDRRLQIRFVLPLLLPRVGVRRCRDEYEEKPPELHLGAEEFLAVRENATAAEAFGIPLLSTRTIAFAISAAYGALGGASVRPSDFLHLPRQLHLQPFDAVSDHGPNWWLWDCLGP